MVGHLTYTYFEQMSSWLNRGFEPMSQINLHFFETAQTFETHTPPTVDRAIVGDRFTPHWYQRRCRRDDRNSPSVDSGQRSDSVRAGSRTSQNREDSPREDGDIFVEVPHTRLEQLSCYDGYKVVKQVQEGDRRPNQGCKEFED